MCRLNTPPTCGVCTHDILCTETIESSFVALTWIPTLIVVASGFHLSSLSLSLTLTGNRVSKERTKREAKMVNLTKIKYCDSQLLSSYNERVHVRVCVCVREREWERERELH